MTGIKPRPCGRGFCFRGGLWILRGASPAQNDREGRNDKRERNKHIVEHTFYPHKHSLAPKESPPEKRLYKKFPLTYAKKFPKNISVYSQKGEKFYLRKEKKNDEK